MSTSGLNSPLLGMRINLSHGYNLLAQRIFALDVYSLAALPCRHAFGLLLYLEM